MVVEYEWDGLLHPSEWSNWGGVIPDCGTFPFDKATEAKCVPSLAVLWQIIEILFHAISYDDTRLYFRRPIAEPSSWVCHFDTAETPLRSVARQPVEEVGVGQNERTQKHCAALTANSIV